MPAVPEPHLVGRESETARLRRRIADLSEHGAAVVVRGDAGLGKTALLADTADFAVVRGVTVYRATGVQSEAQLPFAGLHQILKPLMPLASQLTGTQREALLTAFGMEPGTRPELFLVALAALNLISEEAERTPLLVLVDDAHWLDPSSAAAFAFIARRIEPEPVLLLAAIRDGFTTAFDEAKLAELRLAPLSRTDSESLLDARAPALSAPGRTRTLREAAGNPLALVELPLTLGARADPSTVSAWLPLNTRLERAFSARAADLPQPTQTVLLILAANDGDMLDEVMAAAALVGDRVDGEDLGSALTAGLVEADDSHLRFRHPLARSAIYQYASITDRQAAHAALAEVVVDPDRRAWHRASATTAPADDVAAALDVVAGRARQRGALAVGIAALERAAQLSEASADSGKRLLDAAELGFELGRQDIVTRLVAEAEALTLTPNARAHVIWLRGVFDGGRAGGVTRFDSLIDTALTLAGEGTPVANDLALKMLWSAAIQRWWSDPDSVTGERIVTAMRALPPNPDDPRVLAILAFAAPLFCGAEVAEGVSRLTPRAVAEPDAARILGTAANAIGALDLSASLLMAAGAGLRDQGRLGLLARALTQQAWSAAHRVDLSLGLSVSEEAATLAGITGQPTIQVTARAIQAMLAALRGNRAGAEDAAAEAESYGMPIGARALLAMARHARGVGALADGQPGEAYEHLRRIHDPGDPVYHSFIRCYTTADLVDAATRSGQTDAVRSVVADLKRIAASAPVPVLHAGLRYARPLLAGVSDAEELFGAALAADDAWPFLRARTQLAFGAWLRRHRRVTDSRAPLRAARDAFDALGTVPWSERTRQELRASGETSRSRGVDARDQLTSQELQIAQLAASGLSNREIGQQLFISSRTVGSHLYRIYPKLDITSRSGLRDVI